MQYNTIKRISINYANLAKRDLIGLEIVNETIFTSETVDNNIETKWRTEVFASLPFC